MYTQRRRPCAAFFVSAGSSRGRRRSGRTARACVLMSVLLGVAWSPAQGLETTGELLESGAARLALDRVDRSQPREVTDKQWSQWEILRLRALYALERDKDLLARVTADGAALSEPERGQAWNLAARAALRDGETARALSLAARSLWLSRTTVEEERAVRELVIDGYLAEGNGHAAFRAMLRFGQDYRPLDAATAARFVEGLLALDMASEAANWLSRLEEGSAAKQMLRLQAGLLKPDDAIAHSRARVAKDNPVGHWRVIAEAARRGGNRSAHIEALEKLVQLSGGRKSAEAAASALWETYQSSAVQAANRNHLLAGDDAAWMKYALARLKPDPFIARALFAYLGQRAGSLEARQAAFQQLVFSLDADKLGSVALRLFGRGDVGLTAIDGQTRLRLGTIADANGEPAVAARLWTGLDTPRGMTGAEWELRRALAYWRAGDPEAAVKSLGAATGGSEQPPAKAIEDAIGLGRDIVAMGRNQLTDASLPILLKFVGPKHQRELFMALGTAAEQNGRFAQAGAYFLRAALSPDGRSAEMTAAKARLAAAQNLSRAGYRADARAQFEWVIRHSGNAAEREVARKGQARL